MPQLPGEFGYIANIEHYKEIHPKGIANGQNVFCVGPNSYVGFGQFFTVRKSAEEIIEDLYKETHKPIVGDEQSPFSPFVKNMQKVYGNLEYWSEKRNEHQAKYFSYKFDVELIGMFRSGKVNAIKQTQCLIGQGQLEKLIATFPITEPLPCHKELFNQVLGDKSEEQLNDIIAVANSVVGGTIHPYEYYKLLLLAAHFGGRENARNAFAKTDEKNAASIARADGLGLYRDSGSFQIINSLTLFTSGSIELKVVTQEDLKRLNEKNSKRATLVPENEFPSLSNTIISTMCFAYDLPEMQNLVDELLSTFRLKNRHLIDPLQDHRFLEHQTIEANLEPRNQVQKLAVLPQIDRKKPSGLMVYIAELMRGPIKASVYSIFRKN